MIQVFSVEISLPTKQGTTRAQTQHIEVVGVRLTAGAADLLKIGHEQLLQRTVGSLSRLIQSSEGNPMLCEPCYSE